MTILRIDESALKEARKLEADEQMKTTVKMWAQAMPLFNKQASNFEAEATHMVKCSRSLYALCDKKLGEKGLDKEMEKSLTTLRKQAYDFVTKMKAMKIA